MEYTIFILLLPFLSFILTGLLGTKLKPVAAGTVGTVVTGIVAALSYLTALCRYRGTWSGCLSAGTCT